MKTFNIAVFFVIVISVIGFAQNKKSNQLPKMHQIFSGSDSLAVYTSTILEVVANKPKPPDPDDILSSQMADFRETWSFGPSVVTPIESDAMGPVDLGIAVNVVRSGDWNFGFQFSTAQVLGAFVEWRPLTGLRDYRDLSNNKTMIISTAVQTTKNGEIFMSGRFGISWTYVALGLEVNFNNRREVAKGFFFRIQPHFTLGQAFKELFL